jgi:hypothetical protein
MLRRARRDDTRGDEENSELFGFGIANGKEGGSKRLWRVGDITSPAGKTSARSS